MMMFQPCVVNCDRLAELPLKALTKNLIKRIDIASLTQLVECRTVNPNVTGSSPVGGAFGPVAQSG